MCCLTLVASLLVYAILQLAIQLLLTACNTFFLLGVGVSNPSLHAVVVDFSLVFHDVYCLGGAVCLFFTRSVD